MEILRNRPEERSARQTLLCWEKVNSSSSPQQLPACIALQEARSPFTFTLSPPHVQGHPLRSVQLADFSSSLYVTTWVLEYLSRPKANDKAQSYFMICPIASSQGAPNGARGLPTMGPFSPPPETPTSKSGSGSHQAHLSEHQLLLVLALASPCPHFTPQVPPFPRLFSQS